MNDPYPHEKWRTADTIGIGVFVAVIMGLILYFALSEPTKPTEPTVRAPGTYHLPYLHRSAEEFRLDDGTRCVTTNNGGIACDWRQP